MPAFHVSASEVVNVPLEKAYNSLIDFNEWPIWSPWLIMERECQVDYKGQPGTQGHGYSWAGKKIGSGEMTLVGAGDRQNSQHRKIDCKLLFLKPFKSKADVDFELEVIDANSTKVTWNMDSSLPFFMFFMVKKMQAFIRNDYERGLLLLKEYLETGSVHMKINVEGVVNMPNEEYLGLSASTTKAGMHDSMQSSFSTLMSSVRDSGVEITGAPFSLYDNIDMVKDQWNYTVGIPVDGSSAVANLTAGTRGAGKAVKVTHHGSYQHLGNAWAMGMGELQYKKLKASKTNKPFEIYINDPESTKEEELLTEVYIPLR